MLRTLLLRTLCPLLIAGLFGLPVQAQDSQTEHRAVRVTMMGGFVGFDEGAYKALMASVGRLVSEGLIGKYTIESYGLEGGSTFCMELVPYPHALLEPVASQLKSIQPNKETTRYSFETLEKCQ